MHEQLKNAKRIVIKVGTSTLAYSTGRLNIRRVEKLVKVLSDIKNMGKEIVLVSSGAIGVGAGVMGLATRPREAVEKQAAAAVGQCELMNRYSCMFGDFGHTVAQILLTKNVVEDSISKTNAENTFMRLIDYGVIPIVNENDTISTEEAEFGDNDTLSAVVAALCNADALVILSDIEGVYSSNPKTDKNAKLITEIDDIENMMGVAKDTTNSLGTGGMITKLRAASIAKQHGIATVIACGSYPENLYEIIEGNDCGTFIPA